MKCKCGGEMVAEPQGPAFLAKAMRKHKPWSKNRRIRKKQEKRFAASPEALSARLVVPLFSGAPPFRCRVCETLEGHYSTVGRNVVIIEPLRGLLD